jgi:hypothetical protein
MASSFSIFITDLDVDHEYVEVEERKCDSQWDYSDAIIWPR